MASRKVLEARLRKAQERLTKAMDRATAATAAVGDAEEAVAKARADLSRTGGPAVRDMVTPGVAQRFDD